MDMRVYDAKDDISQRVYYQIKIIEIITYLYELNISAMDNNYKTYTDAQIRVVRKIKNHLSRDIASYISLEVLANSYGINLTTLKNCFRDMYGKPLYTWYREYKFLRAKELIKNTDYPISKIANMIGYKSSSKFTKAFKKEMGVLPSSYRKNKK
jgi:AraC-like DNA-binding protein